MRFEYLHWIELTIGKTAAKRDYGQDLHAQEFLLTSHVLLGN